METVTVELTIKQIRLLAKGLTDYQNNLSSELMLGKLSQTKFNGLWAETVDIYNLLHKAYDNL